MTKKKQPHTHNNPPSNDQPPAPNWPALKPLPPPSDLSLSTLVESQIILIPNFWTKKLCKNYVAFLGSLPLITTPGKPKKGEALRVNDRFQVMDEAFANRLWLETGLKELICGHEARSDDEETMSAEERNELWSVVAFHLCPVSASDNTGVGKLWASIPESESTDTQKASISIAIVSFVPSKYRMYIMKYD